ncbi:MAG: hypothetical protein JWR26_3061 [Pedosphaera sp.]|nr:hypothetical protein [Pedosphaera sp.]
MKNQTVLDQIEPELMQRVISRRGAFRRLGLATAGILSVPAAIGLMSREAFGAFLPAQITDALNFAILVERLEYELYHRGLNTQGLIPQQFLPVYRVLVDHEREHLQALNGVLIGQRKPQPDFDYTAGGLYPEVFRNYNDFTAVAQMLEDTGVRAYKGQFANLMTYHDMLTLVLQIHSVEARHASEIRRLRGEKGWITGSSRGTLPATAQPVYDGEANMVQGPVDLAGLTHLPPSAVTAAFDEPLTKREVLLIIQPFIVGL